MIKKRKWSRLILFFVILFLGLGGHLTTEAAETSLKVPTDSGALVSVGAVPYQYATKTWDQWKDHFSRLGYSYSHCYYEVEIWGGDRNSKVSDICWCAFTKGGKVYWSPLLVNSDGTYTIPLNHWNCIGPSTNSQSAGGSYTGSGAYWYYTNGNGLIYQDTWIHVPISSTNIYRLGYFYVNASGHMLTGWNRDTAGNWYYFKIDHVTNEDGASVKTGVSSDMNCSTICWKEVKPGAGSGSYGLYRYDGIDVRTNFYIMDTQGNYPASYQHSSVVHMTPVQVPPLNPGSSVSYDSASEAFYTAAGLYQDGGRGNCGQSQSVYLKNQDWQSVSIPAFQCYIGRRQYTQTVFYRRLQQGMWQIMNDQTRTIQAYYESAFSVSAMGRNDVGYKQVQVLKNGACFPDSSYVVSGNNQIYFDYAPVQYTVKYLGNGADAGSMPDSCYSYDNPGFLAANRYSRTNHRFQGWALWAGGEAVYQNQAWVNNWSAEDGKQICLYAVWKQIMTTGKIRVYQKDVSGRDYVLCREKSMECGLGNVMQLSALAEQEKENGFHFSYGTVDGAQMEQWTVAGEDEHVICLYFDRDQYEVTLQGEPGLNQIRGAGVYYYGAPVEITAELGEGYSFMGWQSAEIQGTRELTFSFAMPAANVGLTGKTRAHTYDIVFDGNGATEGDMSDIKIHAVFGEHLILPENGYQRVTDQGTSLFCGWSTDSGTLYSRCEYQAGESVSSLTGEDGAMVTLYAIWDDMPGITATDLYYTLEEAQGGAITYEELMSHASAYDREEITDENPSGELKSGKDEERETAFSIVDYEESDFLNFAHGGSVTITYQAVDAGGNRTRKQIGVYLADTRARPVDTTQTRLRFISGEYRNTLAEDSRWRTDGQCVDLLNRVLEGRESFCSYEFSTGSDAGIFR